MMKDLCSVSDDEIDSNYLGADISQFDFEVAIQSNGPIPKNCLTEIESIFQNSKLQNFAFYARSEQSRHIEGVEGGWFHPEIKYSMVI